MIRVGEVFYAYLLFFTSMLAPTTKARLASGVAFFTGYVDVLCVKRFACYGTKMSGALVVASKSPMEASLPVAALLCYYLGVFVYRAVGLLAPRAP